MHSFCLIILPRRVCVRLYSSAWLLSSDNVDLVGEDRQVTKLRRKIKISFLNWGVKSRMQGAAAIRQMVQDYKIQPQQNKEQLLPQSCDLHPTLPLAHTHDTPWELIAHSPLQYKCKTGLFRWTTIYCRECELCSASPYSYFCTNTSHFTHFDTFYPCIYVPYYFYIITSWQNATLQNFIVPSIMTVKILLMWKQ